MWKEKKEIQQQCNLIEIEREAYPVVKGFNGQTSKLLNKTPTRSK